VDDSDLTSTGTGPHDKSKDVHNLNLPNTGDGTLSGPGVNGGYADRRLDDSRSPAEAVKKVEVCCDSLPFRCNVVLTPSQGGGGIRKLIVRRKGRMFKGSNKRRRRRGSVWRNLKYVVTHSLPMEYRSDPIAEE